MNFNSEQLASAISGAKNGDKDSFAVLYQEYYPDVYFTCVKVLNDHQNAEDIVQDTFIEVFTNIHMLNDVNSFRAWINRIAVNKSINFLKRMKNIPATEPRPSANDGRDGF